MSDTAGPESSVVIPFKPISVGDQYGLSAAVYAINAWNNRNGKKILLLDDVRKRIAKLISSADVASILLMLQEWYLEEVNEESITTLLRALPSMIENDDYSRYSHGPVVNDIEWSALATMYRCCIAVKFLFDKKSKLNEMVSKQSWKIAVPTPKSFAVPVTPGGSSPGNVCVFMVCHASEKLNTYVALIPCDQEVFVPGRSLLQNCEKGIKKPSKATTKLDFDERASSSTSTIVVTDSGINPTVKFEGYLNETEENMSSERRVTFAGNGSSQIQNEETKQIIEETKELLGKGRPSNETMNEELTSQEKADAHATETIVSETVNEFEEIVKTKCGQTNDIFETANISLGHEVEESNANKNQTSSLYAHADLQSSSENKVESIDKSSKQQTHVNINSQVNSVSEGALVAVYAEKGVALTPRHYNGRLELEIGELSDATILFDRVYGDGKGEEETPKVNHGKLRRINSLKDVFSKISEVY